MPLRVICRRALQDDELVANPTTGLRMPRPAGSRQRAAHPTELAELFAALPEAIRPIYQTAAFAGLRRGELRGLRWGDVDFATNEIAVRRSWDEQAGEVTPKSRAGVRTVPMIPEVRRGLIEHRMRSGHGEDDCHVFASSRDPRSPFTSSNIRRQAATAWRHPNAERAKDGLPPLTPLKLHEARHCYVSLTHAAGLPLETIADLVGHSGTYMTEAYRHLLDGQAEGAAAKLDAYLSTPQATPQAR